MKLTYRIPAGYKYPPYLLDLIEGNHVLIAGTVGSGKSVLENAVLRSLLCTKFPGSEDNGQNARFVLIDPKKVELDIYKTLPHTIMYADNISAIESALNRVRNIVDMRLAQMKAQGIRKSKECPIYVFIDEMLDIVTSNRGKEISRLIADIVSISRATNIFFVMLTQAPNRKVLRPEIVLNCNCRVALRCNSPIESRQIIGSDEATLLPKHGLGIVIQNIDSYQIEIPFFSDSEIEELVKEWTKQHKLYNYFRRRMA